MPDSGDVVPDSGDGVPEVEVVTCQLGEMLLRNSERVARLGSHIGLFEWALFAYWFSVKVTIHLGGNIIDPIRHLLPGFEHDHENRARAAGDREPMHVA